jgi:DNA-binding MarR family transcriptional regulator
MLRALEARGLVKRKRSIHDRRQREISLTKVGLARVRGAYQSLRRAVQRLTDTALCREHVVLCDHEDEDEDEGEDRYDWKHRDKNFCFRQMARLDDLLTALRSYFGDVSTLHYYWGHPDD